MSGATSPQTFAAPDAKKQGVDSRWRLASVKILIKISRVYGLNTMSSRVLSIQSHVVSGFVGNKAACFPLQLLGWDVDALNTIEFSNHTGYGRWGGSKFDAQHIKDIFLALEANGLLTQARLLTGYTPSAESLRIVTQIVDRLKEINPRLVYILDPVMGDDGRVYVSESVIPMYKALIPKATCATPNYFEAELLTDVKIVDAKSLRLSLATFHSRYRIPNVIVTAVSLPGSVARELSLPVVGQGKMLVCAGSTIISQAGEPTRTKAFAIAFPEYDEHYEGVGDTFSALVAARLFTGDGDKHPISPLAYTAELAIASLQGILKNTRAHAVKLSNGRPDVLVAKNGESVDDRVRRLRMVELRLVQSQQEILNPARVYGAVEI